MSLLPIISSPIFPPSAPVNTVLPSIVGSPYVGNTVSANVGSWTGYPAPTYAYDWKIDGVSTGITTSTYVVQAADDTKTLTVAVTATNGSGSASATSAGVVVGKIPVNTVAPTISGTAAVGQTLTAANGTWTGTATISYTYQWKRAGVAISAATASTYVLVLGDVASAITCDVAASNSYGSASAVGSSNSITPAIPVNTVAPAVTGSTNVGQTLTCSTGTWTSAPALTYTYQWKRDGVSITGETASTYVQVLGDVGSYISCTVTATSVNGSASQASNIVGPVTAAASPAMSLPFATSRSLVDTVGSKNVTFSRASLATMYDSTGKLTYCPNNLLLNTATLSSWTNTVTVTTGVSDPDGGTNAITLTATGNFQSSYMTFTSVVGMNYLTTVWVRRRTGTGTIQITDVNNNSTVIVPTGSWAQYTLNASATGTTGFSPVLFIATSGDAIDVYMPVVAAVTYETSSRSADQVITTGAAYYGPRFDYNPATLASRGLLVEESRTNLALYSAAFENAAWSIFNVQTISAGSTTAPDGTASAETFTSIGVTAGQLAYTTNPITATTGANYAFSVFVKKGTHRYVCISQYFGANNNIIDAVFDLDGGTSSATETHVGVDSGTIVSTSQESVGNGWYRLTLVGSGTGTSRYLYIGFATAATGNSFRTDGGVTFTGTGAETFYTWGAQFEAGSFATSYIPTAGSSVTRAADSASMTGTDFSGWINHTNGTFYSNAIGHVNSGPGVLATYSAATDIVRMGQKTTSPGSIAQIFVAGAFQGQIAVTDGTWDGATSNKLAFAYKANDCAFCVNAGTVGTDNTMSVPSGDDRLIIGGSGVGESLNGWIASIDYYSSRLPDATLQTLTA